MRKPRGKLYEQPGIFHIESHVHTQCECFTKAQAELYETWLKGLADIYGFELFFWQFHQNGFSVILKTDGEPTPSPSTLASGLATIGETKLSMHITSPETGRLIPHDSVRLERFRQHYHNLMEFAKGLKQRISRQHNQRKGTRGSIWANRIAIYRLPEIAHDLTEVAAFIFAGPQIHGNAAPSDWPGSYRAAAQKDPAAIRGLKRIFRNRCTTEVNLETIIMLGSQIAQTARHEQEKANESRAKRGRKPQWRPNCETKEYLESNDLASDGTEYRQQTENAKRDFMAMFERFKRFQQKTGHREIPHGYAEDVNLRLWASKLRGLYNAGRLPQWKFDLISNTGLLDRPTTGCRYISQGKTKLISTKWVDRYNELKSYYEKHGHSKVPRTYTVNKRLASWVWIQRAKRRKSQLQSEQIELLDKLEFNWNPRHSPRMGHPDRAE